MRFIKQRGGYLYQHRPDVIPQGWMTPDEMALWAAFFEREKQEAKNG